jgi:putative redox protein
MSEKERREVVVRGRGSRLTQEIEIDRHRLIADEPQSVGGADQGPNPYDLLLAALGSCKSMTATMYAQRKGWALEGVTVRLRHERVHAKDCADCAERDVRLERIDCELAFAGDLSSEQRGRLLEIANRCPVHRTLTSGIAIESRLV